MVKSIWKGGIGPCATFQLPSCYLLVCKGAVFTKVRLYPPAIYQLYTLRQHSDHSKNHYDIGWKNISPEHKFMSDSLLPLRVIGCVTNNKFSVFKAGQCQPVNRAILFTT